jgi:Rps23 Pro-64 3,4-dihydroxylase Tpa1-like proline 4-hydroxylase
MICELFDNIFDPLYIHETHSAIMDIPVSPNNVANRYTKPYGFEGSHRLYGKTIFERKDINRVDVLDLEHSRLFFDMYDMIEDLIGVRFYLSQISLNVQHTGCDGTPHIDCNIDDEDEYTILVMTNSSWEKSWGGEFQIMNDKNLTEVVEEHDYVPGRVVILPSNRHHRGLGPKEKYKYRTSVVFRVTPNFSKHVPEMP